MISSEFTKARVRLELSVGESLRIMRELSQNQLATLTGIPQSTLSALENGRIMLGVERVKILARAALSSCSAGDSGLGCECGIGGLGADEPFALTGRTHLRKGRGDHATCSSGRACSVFALIAIDCTGHPLWSGEGFRTDFE